MRIYSNSSLYYARNCFSAIPNKNSRTFTSNPKNHSVIDSLYGGNKEITKEDALLYKYWQENPISISISIFDKDSSSKVIHDVSKIPKEFIDNLNNTEITEWDKKQIKLCPGLQHQRKRYQFQFRPTCSYVCYDSGISKNKL